MFDPMKNVNQVLRADVYDASGAALGQAQELLAQSFRGDTRQDAGKTIPVSHQVVIWFSVTDLSQGKVSVLGLGAPSKSDYPQGPYADGYTSLDDDNARQILLYGLAIALFHQSPGRCSVQVICEHLPDWAPQPRQFGYRIWQNEVGTIIAEPLIHPTVHVMPPAPKV